MVSRWHSVVIDATDPRRLSRWWATVLDYAVIDETDGMTTIGSLDQPQFVFVRAHDVKSNKNRIRIGLDTADKDAEVERLVDMGARHVDIGQKEQPGVVLADPEGNEFCVVASP